jgi:hypothetical protein
LTAKTSILGVLKRVVDKIAIVKENKGTKVYENTFAGELVKSCMNSGTSRICIERRASYIYGGGFVDETLAETKANKNQTFAKLLATSSQNAAILKAVCYRVMVDHNGEIFAVYNVPVDKVDRTSDNRFRFNPTKNTDNFDRTLDKFYDEFNPQMSPQQRAVELQKELQRYGTQQGRFVYVFNQGIGQEYYSIPPAYSGIEDIKTDAQLSSYELENLENGFMPSALLTLIGKVDDTIINEQTGKTEKDELKASLSSFTAKDGGRARLLVMAAETKEQVPVLQQMDASKILDGLDKITDRVGRKVCRLFEIPPVLAGFEDASILGSNQTFKNALTILQHSVKKDQDLIIEALNIIYPNYNFEIKQLQLIDYIPAEVMAKLTDDELRGLAGYEPLESDIDGNTVTMAERLGVGGTQALVATLSDPLLTPEQKQNALVILFGLSIEDAMKLAPKVVMPYEGLK